MRNITHVSRRCKARPFRTHASRTCARRGHITSGQTRVGHIRPYHTSVSIAHVLPLPQGHPAAAPSRCSAGGAWSDTCCIVPCSVIRCDTPSHPVCYKVILCPSMWSCGVQSVSLPHTLTVLARQVAKFLMFKLLRCKVPRNKGTSWQRRSGRTFLAPRRPKRSCCARPCSRSGRSSRPRTARPWSLALARKGTKGVNTNGVSANLIMFFI